MKNRAIYFLIITAMTVFSSADSHGADGWAIAYGGDSNDEDAIIRQSSDGGYIMACTTQSFWVYGTDIWVVKLDNAGAIQWQNTYGGDYVERFYDIRQTSDGGYIVAGSTLSFGDGSYDDYDIWILRLSSAGVIQWQKIFGVKGNWQDECPKAVYQTADGGYIVAGYNGEDVKDFFLLKLDTGGNISWHKSYGTRGPDYCSAMQPTREGGYIVIGQTDPNDSGNNDFWAIKLDSGGAVQWQKTYGGGKNEYASWVLQTADGGYVIAGETESFGAGNTDIWVLKLSSTGTVEWQKAYGGSRNDTVSVVWQSADGGFVVAGQTESFGEESGDMWVLKLSGTGTVVWQKAYGGPYFDKADSIAASGNGLCLVAGHSSSFGAGAYDICLLNIDANGSLPGCANTISGNTTGTTTDTNGAVKDTAAEPTDSATAVQETTATAEPSAGAATDICLLEPFTTTTITSGTTTIPVFTGNTKAVIVAGGGPFSGNALWDETEMLANYAFKTLKTQGFFTDSIYYLTSNTNADVEPDGIPDADADATVDNLKNTLAVLASKTDDVIIYLVDHGGPGTFRMNETEILYADDLEQWLNDLQTSIPGKIIVVYDACQSGSFIPLLKPAGGKERIIIASSAANESAFFLTQGTISFSRYFWSGIFSGNTVYDAFTSSKDAMETGGFQTAILDDNGNGKGNEKSDGALAADYIIGFGSTTGADCPVIDTIMPPLTLHGEISAALWVKDITSSSPILTVWAVINGPGDSPDNASRAITDLPAIPLLPGDNGEYRGTYSGFTARGTYNISAYVQNTQGAFSFPVTTSVIQTQATLCPAMVAVGGNGGTIQSLHAFRDTILSGTPDGKRYIALYYKHAHELSALLLNNPDIRSKTAHALYVMLPAIKSIMLHKKVMPLFSDQKEIITDAIQSICEHASRQLREDIARENFRELFPEKLISMALCGQIFTQPQTSGEK